MLAPWNAVLSTMPFFLTELPDTNIAYMISFALNGVAIFVVIFVVIFGDSQLNRYRKINCNFVATAVLIAFIPIVVRDSTTVSKQFGYWTTITVLTGVGVLATVA